MSTTARNASQVPPSAQQPEASGSPEKTVFFKPCFGITVQSSTLCVSVSAKPDTSPQGPPACG